MARPKGIWTPEIVRERIRTSKLVERLIKHSLGEVEMSPQQAASLRFAIERVIPRAEAPKQLDITGRLTLDQLLTEALNVPVSDGRPASHSH